MMAAPPPRYAKKKIGRGRRGHDPARRSAATRQGIKSTIAPDRNLERAHVRRPPSCCRDQAVVDLDPVAPPATPAAPPTGSASRAREMRKHGYPGLSRSGGRRPRPRSSAGHASCAANRLRASRAREMRKHGYPHHHPPSCCRDQAVVDLDPVAPPATPAAPPTGSASRAREMRKHGYPGHHHAVAIRRSSTSTP